MTETTSTKSTKKKRVELIETQEDSVTKVSLRTGTAVESRLLAHIHVPLHITLSDLRNILLKSGELGHQGFEFVWAGGSRAISRAQQDTVKIIDLFPGLPLGRSTNPLYLLEDCITVNRRIHKSKDSSPRIIECLAVLFVRRGDVFSLEKSVVERLLMQNNIMGPAPSLQQLLSVMNSHNANIRDFCGRTILQDCCSVGNAQAVRMLLSLPFVDPAIKDHQGYTALHVAISKDRNDVVSMLLPHPGVDLLAQSVSGMTPLHIALYRRNDALTSAICAALQYRKILPDALKSLTDCYGRNPLEAFELLIPTFHECAYSGNVAAMRALRGHYLFNLDSILNPGMNGRNIVHEATAGGHVEVLKYLLHEVKINCFSPGWSADHNGAGPLHYACRYGHTAILAMLLDHGLDPGITCHSQRTPLHVALYERRWNCAICLLRHAEMNQREIYVDAIDALGNSALHIAVSHGQYEIVEILLSKFHASVNLRANLKRRPKHKRAVMPDVPGESALHIACMSDQIGIGRIAGTPAVSLSSNQMSLAMLLIGFRAGHENHTAQDISKTLCMCIQRNAYALCHEIIRIPVYRVGLDPQILRKFVCLATPNYSAVQWLLDNGANMDLTDAHGLTTLGYAVSKGFTKGVELLLQNGASVAANATNLLSLACSSPEKRSVTDIVALLLRAGESVSDSRGGGDLPIDAAASTGNFLALKMLLAAGATLRSTTLFIALRNAIRYIRKPTCKRQIERQERAKLFEKIAVLCCEQDVAYGDLNALEVLQMTLSLHFYDAAHALCLYLRRRWASVQPLPPGFCVNLSQDHNEVLCCLARHPTHAPQLLRMVLLDLNVPLEVAAPKTRFTACDVAIRRGCAESTMILLRRGIFPLLPMSVATGRFFVSLRQSLVWKDRAIKERRAMLQETPLGEGFFKGSRTTLFHTLTKNGCHKELRLLMSVHPAGHLESLQDRYPSVLCFAIARQQTECFHALVEYGQGVLAAAHVANDMRASFSPLVTAVCMKDMGAITVLLTRTDVDAIGEIPYQAMSASVQLKHLGKVSLFCSPIHAACAMQELSLVSQLLQRGASLTSGMNPLSCLLCCRGARSTSLSQANTMKIATALISHGVPLLASRPCQNSYSTVESRQMHSFGDEPVNVACEVGFMDLAMTMIENPRVVQNALVQRRTYLHPHLGHHFATCGNLAALLTTLRTPPSPPEDVVAEIKSSRKARKGTSMADYAARALQPAALAMLLFHNVGLHAKRVQDRVTREKREVCYVVNAILRAYWRSQRPSSPQTILHAAVIEGSLAALKCLLSAGFTVKPNLGTEVTPLQLAVCAQREDLATLLLRDKKMVALCSPAYAVLKKSYAFAETLLEKGASANRVAECNLKYKHLVIKCVSPLFAACLHGEERLVVELIRRGALPAASDTLLGKEKAVVEPPGAATRMSLPPLIALMWSMPHYLGAPVEQRERYVRMTELLLSRRALDGLNQEMRSLLIVLSARKRNPSVTTLLLEYGFRQDRALLTSVSPDLFQCVNGKMFVQSLHPTYYALRFFSGELVRLFLECTDPSDVNESIDALGFTLFHIAVLSGKSEAVSILLGMGADLYRCGGKNHRGPLTLACQSGSLDVVKVLLEQIPPDAEHDAHGNTPLMVAAERGHLGVVEALVTAGADLISTNALGYNACMVAAANGHDSIAMSFVQAWLPQYGLVTETSSILHACARGGAIATAKYVLETFEGMQVTDHDDQGQTPLYIARVCGKTEVRRLLMEHSPKDHSGPTINHDATIFGFRSAVLRINSNLPKAASPPLRWCCTRGIPQKAKARLPSYNFLVWCAKFNHVTGVRALYDLGVSDEYGAIHVAARMGAVDALQLLLDLKMSTVDQRDKNACTPLMLAAMEAQASVVSSLLAMGASVVAVDSFGQSALHKIAQCTKHGPNTTRVVASLLSKSNPETIVLLDVFGNTAIHYAIMFNQSELVYRATAMLHPNPIPLDAEFTASLTAIPMAVRILLYDVFDVHDVSLLHGAEASKPLHRLNWPEIRVLGFQDLLERHIVTPNVELEKRKYKALMASLFVYARQGVALKFSFDSMASLAPEHQCRIIQRLGTTLLFGRHIDKLDSTVTEIVLKYVALPAEVSLRSETYGSSTTTVLYDNFCYDIVNDRIITSPLLPDEVVPSMLTERTEAKCRGVEAVIMNLTKRAHDKASTLLRNMRVVVDWTSFDRLPNLQWEEACDGLSGHRGIPALHEFLDRVEPYDIATPPQGPQQDLVVTFTHSSSVGSTDKDSQSSGVVVPFQLRVTSAGAGGNFCCDPLVHLKPVEALLIHQYYSLCAKQLWGHRVRTGITFTHARWLTATDFVSTVQDEIAKCQGMCRGFTTDTCFMLLDDVPGEHCMKAVSEVHNAVIDVQVAFCPEVGSRAREEWTAHVKESVLSSMQDHLEAGICELLRGEILKRLRSHLPQADIAVNWPSFQKIADAENAVIARRVLLHSHSAHVLQPLVQGLSIGWDTKVIGPILRSLVHKVELCFEDSNVSWVAYDAAKKQVNYHCALLGSKKYSASSTTLLSALHIASLLLLAVMRTVPPPRVKELRGAVDTDRAFAAWCVVRGSARVAAGETVRLRVECRNILNEASRATHIQNVSLFLNKTQVPLTQPKLPKLKPESSTLYISFQAPTTAQSYSMRILVRGEAVAFSPDRLVVVSGPAMAKSSFPIIITKKAFDTVVEGVPAKVLLQPRDAYGNPVKLGRVKNGSMTKVSLSSPVNMTTSKIVRFDGAFELTFTAGKGKTVSFGIEINGVLCDQGSMTCSVMPREEYKKYAEKNAKAMRKAIRCGKEPTVPSATMTLPANVAPFTIKRPQDSSRRTSSEKPRWRMK